MKVERKVHSLEETQKLADTFARTIISSETSLQERRMHQGGFINFEGELGAGKTSWIRFMAYRFGVPDDSPVTSPTFSLVHEFLDASYPFVHPDLYRLGDSTELLEIGLEEHLRNPDVLLFTEWGRKHFEWLGMPDVNIEIEFQGQARIIRFNGYSEKGSQWLKSIS